jgi:hypothetical protein
VSIALPPEANLQCHAATDGDADHGIDFPAERWDHLRTSIPIESVFATVRHRTVRTKGSLSATTAKRPSATARNSAPSGQLVAFRWN